jgi:VIT1/CCC1 family predicted Fe2+/Mn2+ transporter
VGANAGADRLGSGKSGALRAGVFGVNDGLVSNLSLIAGVTGGGVGANTVLLAGLAGLVAGSASMAAGEWISVRSQRDLFEHVIHREAHELGTDPDTEREELTRLYRERGLDEDLATRLATDISSKPKLALETHVREELGLDLAALGSPWVAAVASFFAFAFGAFLPVLPFLVDTRISSAPWALALGGLALFAAGAVIGRLTGRGAALAGIRMLAIGALATGVTFLTGRLVGGVVGA